MQLHRVISNPLPGFSPMRPTSPFALSAKVFATSASTPLMHLRSTGVYYTIFFIGAVSAPEQIWLIAIRHGSRRLGFAIEVRFAPYWGETDSIKNLPEEKPSRGGCFDARGARRFGFEKFKHGLGAFIAFAD